jgi:hypothetical protein
MKPEASVFSACQPPDSARGLLVGQRDVEPARALPCQGCERLFQFARRHLHGLVSGVDVVFAQPLIVDERR